MTRTTGRTLALLSLLQARREWSGAELRERLEVSERTLRRDIDDLRELGYGIEAVRGRHGGYRLGAGANLPPLALAPDESVAIAVGLRAAAAGAVTGLEDAAARALAKLERSLSPAVRRQVEDVAESMVPLDPRPADVDLTVVTTIASAIAGRRTTRLDYTRRDGTEVRRVVEPYRIVHTPQRWYLVAFDRERRAWRTLRVDRIRHAVPQDTDFVRRQIPDDAVRQFTTHSITTAPYPFRARVHVHAPADVVRQSFDATVASVTEVDENSSILEAGSHSPDEFALYLGLAGFRFDVLEGGEVRAARAAAGERMTRAAAR
ncbi:helix-turn-helix transcriptional regulator [Rhodococcus rhodnii]|nr:YafY family protein [Rhodococcus rhodnii]